jgi:ABC-type branched-subunit amino acid transport system substrate-binding protein
VFLAYPWVPEDLTATAMRDYEALVAAHGLSKTSRHAQLAALTAATILVEGLARSGRGVTRASFIDTLERLQEFPTGLTPPISYGPNDRVGLSGARIVRVELATGRLVLVEGP